MFGQMICNALLPSFLALTLSNWQEFVVVTRSTHKDEIFPIGIYTFQMVHPVCNKICCFIVLINWPLYPFSNCLRYQIA
jgi:hypothetical protein